MAEREGFEPSIRLLTRYSLSRGAPSASRASLRIVCIYFEPSMVSVPPARTTNDRQNRSIRIKASPLAVKPSDVPASPVGRFVPGRFVGLGRRAATRLVFLLDALVDLFAMHRDIFRRRDTDAYLVALHAQHRNGYLIADHQGFPNPAGQNQHDRTPFTRIHWTRKPRRAFPSGSRIAARQDDREPTQTHRDVQVPPSPAIDRGGGDQTPRDYI